MINVAIIEDQAELSSLWQNLLNYTEGYQCVATFKDMKDAILKLPLLNVNVLLLDTQSPCIRGIRQLRQQCPKVQILMLMADLNDELIFEAIKAGISGCILQKTNLSKVLEAITELHEGGSPMSPCIARRVIESLREKDAPDERWHLSESEWQILDHLMKGLLYKEISDKMGISLAMVKLKIHDIYQKLEVPNRTQAVNKFLGSSSKISILT